MFVRRKGDGLAAIGFALGLLAGLVETGSLAAQAVAGRAGAACRPASSIAPAEALRLAVGLKTYVESTFFQHGSGIIVGDDGHQLYVATAAHVVLDAGGPVDSIDVYFYSGCDRPVRARLCSLADTARGLDLAVLCVPVGSRADAKPPVYSRRGSLGRLGGRNPVYPVGCPGGECWGIGQPDKVLLVSPNQRILFTTFFVAPGHSGGPLFNEWWEVVGMVTRHGQPLSEAIPINTVLEAACDTGCGRRGSRLDKPFVPRGGYRLSVGAAGLFAMTDSDLGGRFPPGRINLMYRLVPLVEAHAGPVRLTPRNLSITGGVVGLGLTVPARGRLLVNPFLEGGFARVEGRYDAGGYFIDDNGTNRYVPFWRQVRDDGIGFGAGLSIQALVLPRTIIEVVAGHWSFSRPENAPSIPAVFVGAGLRLGI